MKIINTLFPLKLQLKILQLEGYDPLRFLIWVSKNFFTRNINTKKELVITAKVKIILTLSILIFILVIILIYPVGIFITLLAAIILFTQPFILLSVTSLFLAPVEELYKKYIILKTRNKILSLKKLKIIAITGSFGKTTTKEILYQILKEKYKVLRTPASYNTILGISKVVDYELDDSYDFFICEMAAYNPGDIKELCFMIPPSYGIITGIASQHLERFGNIENITKTKFELFEKINNSENIIFNLNNQTILNETVSRNIPNPKGYLKAFNIDFSTEGSSFEIEDEGFKKIVRTSLFGYTNVENITGASTMALMLGLDIGYVAERIRHLTPIASRFNLRKYGRATIVDNTFSSNESSFMELIKTAKSIKGKKVLITPGLVELGKLSDEVHKKLGYQAEGVFDKVILVGKNARTVSFVEGLKQTVEFIDDSRKEYATKIDQLKNFYDWIFLENDVTENY